MGEGGQEETQAFCFMQLKMRSDKVFPVFYASMLRPLQELVEEKKPF